MIINLLTIQYKFIKGKMRKTKYNKVNIVRVAYHTQYCNITIFGLLFSQSFSKTLLFVIATLLHNSDLSTQNVSL